MADEGRHNRKYHKPKPHLITPQRLALFIPWAAGVLMAGLRTAAGAYLVSHVGLPEAISCALCIEGAEVAFLMRWMQKRETQERDSFSLLVLLTTVATSISFSILLAFLAADRLPVVLVTLAGRQVNLALLAVVIAAVGVNLTTLGLSRLIPHYLRDYEQELATWLEAKARWENRQIQRQETKNRLESIVSTPSTPSIPSIHLLSSVDLDSLILDACLERDHTVDELMSTLGRGRSTVYKKVSGLVQAGQLVKIGKFYHRNGRE